jgi:hypothetical protein
MTAPAPSHGKARDRGVDLLGTGRLDRRLPFIEVLSANSSTAPLGTLSNPVRRGQTETPNDRLAGLSSEDTHAFAAAVAFPVVGLLVSSWRFDPKTAAVCWNRAGEAKAKASADSIG